MKKIISAVMICFLGVYGAQAVSSVSDGNWENAATWDTGVPGSGDVANLLGHSVTINTPISGSLDWVELKDGYPSNHLVLQNGADMTVNRNIIVNSGSLDVETGATLTKGTGTPYMNIVGGGNGRQGTMNINGGTFTTPQYMYVAYAAPAGIATLNVNDGLFSVGGQCVFDARYLGNEERINVYGGTAEFNFIEFAYRGVTCVQETLVDGGDLVLTTDNEGGAFVFSAPTSRVFYESGSITFQGVDTEAEFNTFATIFNGWVDDGNVASSTLTGQQLKDSLSFIGGDAVVIPEPATMGLIGIGGVLLFLRRRAL